MQNIIAINPTTNLSICKNVNLDNTYTDTMTFPNATAQYTFFKTKEKYFFEQLTPIDIKNNTIRVNVNANNLYDCNYIIFQNSNWSAKYFYAFITDIEFLSPDVSLITFEIDVMQSWYFDMKLQPSYVLREHITTDSIGANTQPEPLNIPFYTYNNEGTSGFFRFDKFYIVVASSYSGKANSIGDLKGGVFSGVQYFYYLPDEQGIADLTSLLDTLLELGKEENIVDIFMFPYEFFPSGNNAVLKEINIPKATYIDSLDGYKPKNNKLFSYPFNMINIDNGCGSERDLRIEKWQADNNNLVFDFYGTISTNPTVIAFPKNYNGVTYGIKDIIEISNFPKCSWSGNSFKAYLAQNATGIASNLITNVASFNAVGTINAVTNLAQQAIAPEYKTFGSTNGADVKFSSGVLDIKFRQKCITREYAKMFDDFLSKFGYATNLLKVPNIVGRKSWNYVKTEKANINGSIPFNHLSKIKSIFDSGITFWHGDYVGDYTRDN